ncbi:MAG: trehalose-6-phosphate synthase, partial [Dehalococcoidia bacterium]|nr:trehalose-6-phosphate synthase [Dehalococcoidia bacterium]
MATARDLLTWPVSSARHWPDVEDPLKLIPGRKRIVLASNRGPFQYSLDGNGELVCERGQGGLVTALSAMMRHARVAWVASSMSDGDREASRRLDARPGLRAVDENLRLRLVNVAPGAYRQHYEVFSNPVLWLLQHSLGDELIDRTPLSIREAWRWGYLPVNRALAGAIVDELNKADTLPCVFIHDYHLYLAGHYVRQRAPHAFLQHFTHIPWPAPGDGLRLLGSMWRKILHCLLANDIVAFQTQRDVRNFLNDCEFSLPGAHVDGSAGAASYLGRRVEVRSYPISVDVGAIQEQARSPEFAAYRSKLMSGCGEFTIVKVERVDPTKNTVLSMEAFRQMLISHPDLLGRVTMLAFLVPSRTSIPEYRRFKQRLLGLVDSINGQFGRPGYLPVQVFYEDNYLQALAGMSFYDVLLVNPVADGMNLVAKEGPLVNRKDGVLVLSETAGAHDQLELGALSVRHGDLKGTADALYRALYMPMVERRRRAAFLRS